MAVVLPARNQHRQCVQELEPLFGSVAPLAAPLRRDNVGLGMLWYAASSIFFTGMGTCSKMLGQKGYPVWEITLWRAVVILSCCISVLVSDGALPLCVIWNQTLPGL
jgi:hypothetical protein